VQQHRLAVQQHQPVVLAWLRTVEDLLLEEAGLVGPVAPASVSLLAVELQTAVVSCLEELLGLDLASSLVVVGELQEQTSGPAVAVEVVEPQGQSVVVAGEEVHLGPISALAQVEAVVQTVVPGEEPAGPLAAGIVVGVG